MQKNILMVQMNTSTFAGDLMSEMLPLVELARLSANPRYSQAFAREILNPNRMQEAFEAAIILDRPIILEKLINMYGDPGALNPDFLEDYDENAPVQADELIADIFRNKAGKTFAYLYNRYKDINDQLKESLDASIAIALTNIINDVRRGILTVDDLYQIFDILLMTDPDLEWHIVDLADFMDRSGDKDLEDAIQIYRTRNGNL